MPELPEVEVVRRGLSRLIIGRTILHCRVSKKRLRKPLSREKLQKYVVGSQVENIDRRAKFLLISLSNGALLIFHLGMTGKLGVVAQNATSRAHDHLCFLLDNGNELRFNDIRRFGSVTVLSPEEAAGHEWFAGLGPEPLGEEFSASGLQAQALNKNKPIKNLLMDQSVVVGIGNIYANEILFASRINPLRSARSITAGEWRTIVRQTRAILKKAIAAGGTTINDFENESGRPGYFQLALAVYGKTGQSCPRCRTPITRLVMAGRATFFCRVCQK